MKAWICLAFLLASAAPVGAQSEFVVAAPPRLHAYLDTASLRTALARLPVRPYGRRTERLFRLEWDSTGQPLAPTPAVARAMPARHRDAVLPLIRAALRPTTPHQGGWAAFVLVDAGNPPRIEEVFPSEQPARLVNAAAVHQTLYQHAQRLLRADTSLVGLRVSVRVAMDVNEAGAVTASRLVSSSGITALDEAALRAARSARFRPSSLDGEPVPSTVVLPFQVVFSGD
jgi:TonB family protein